MPEEQVNEIGPVVELCCGLGGMGLAMAQLGVQVAAGFDLSEQAVAVYRENAVGKQADVLDLLDAASPKLLKQLCRSVNSPELVLAGPPCKGVSRLRNGNHDESHNQVIEVLPTFIAALRPRLVILENVPELRTHGGDRQPAGDCKADWL